MADYFKNGPKFLEVDPTRDMPFVKVYDAEYTRGYQCPRVELIDVTHEIKQALLVRFQYARVSDFMGYRLCKRWQIG